MTKKTPTCGATAGLGKSRRQRWVALTEGVNTVEQLAKVMCLTQQTVRQHLVRITRLDMAGPTSKDARRGEWQPYPVDWEWLEQHRRSTDAATGRASASSVRASSTSAT